MAAVPIQIDGVFFPANKMQAPVKGSFLGHASIFGLGIGGGPIMPPDGGIGEPPVVGGGPIFPPGIWPTPPGGGKPPGIWGPTDPRPTHPIVIPLPPETPNLPPAGSPPVAIEGTQPVNPMTPPPAVLIDYPGIGKVVVPQPTESVPMPPHADHSLPPPQPSMPPAVPG